MLKGLDHFVTLSIQTQILTLILQCTIASTQWNIAFNSCLTMNGLDFCIPHPNHTLQFQNYCSCGAQPHTRRHEERVAGHHLPQPSIWTYSPWKWNSTKCYGLGGHE